MEQTNEALLKGKSVKEYLDSLKPLELTEDPFVRSKFIQNYMNIHGSGNKERDLQEATQKYEQEHIYFTRKLVETPKLQQCTMRSLYGCFIDIAVMDITMSQFEKQAYLLQRGIKTGAKDGQGRDIYIQAAYIELQAWGEAAIRIKAGQIKNVYEPTVVYKGDTFKPFLDERGHKRIKYEGNVPPQSEEIIACFVVIERPTGEMDYPYLTQMDIERLASYSEKNNRFGDDKGKSNALYKSNNGQIDVGFLKTKTVKHALKPYRALKIRLGNFTEVEPVNEVEPIATVQPDYAIEPEEPGNTSENPETPSMQMELEQPSESGTGEIKVKNESFNEGPATTTKGRVVIPEDMDF